MRLEKHHQSADHPFDRPVLITLSRMIGEAAKAARSQRRRRPDVLGCGYG
jgi:hypothetical protein